ncbi:MAG: hypothetical protein Q9200_005513 [Gallowayella weberi]
MGLGKHPYAIDPTKISQTLKLYTVAVPFGLMVPSLSTLAIAICLNNLIAPTKRQRCILYIFPYLQMVIAIVGIILIFTQCKPRSTLWKPQKGARCLDKSVLLGWVYLMSVYVAFVDFFLAIVPLVAFWQLQIKPKAKFILCLLMSGTAIIEGNVIIIAACLPDLRPFVKHVRSKDLVKNTLSLPSSVPPPLPLGHKTSQHKISDASTSLPSPLSPRRMEPRPSGSVSGSLQPPDYKTYRLNSFERLESNQRAQNEKFIGWRPGFDGAEGDMAEMNEMDGKNEERRSVGGIEAQQRNEAVVEEEHGEASAEQTEENEEKRGRTGQPGPADDIAVEVIDENTVESGAVDPAGEEEEERRASQVQELREILAESRASARQSWIEEIRERVDKRMTI